MFLCKLENHFKWLHLVNKRKLPPCLTAGHSFRNRNSIPSRHIPTYIAETFSFSECVSLYHSVTYYKRIICIFLLLGGVNDDSIDITTKFSNRYILNLNALWVNDEKKNFTSTHLSNKEKWLSYACCVCISVVLWRNNFSGRLRDIFWKMFRK